MTIAVTMRLNEFKVLSEMQYVMGAHWTGNIKDNMKGLLMNSYMEMSFEELENSELERMKFNAFKVCDELTFLIEAAPAPGGYMKAYTSERN